MILPINFLLLHSWLSNELIFSCDAGSTGNCFQLESWQWMKLIIIKQQKYNPRQLSMEAGHCQWGRLTGRNHTIVWILSWFVYSTSPQPLIRVTVSKKSCSYDSLLCRNGQLLALAWQNTGWINEYGTSELKIDKQAKIKEIFVSRSNYQTLIQGKYGRRLYCDHVTEMLCL